MNIDKITGFFDNQQPYKFAGSTLGGPCQVFSWLTLFSRYFGKILFYGRENDLGIPNMPWAGLL